jgi:hypothetical protein
MMVRKGHHHLAVSLILRLQVLATTTLEAPAGLPFNPAN